jgi:hypothetical protein
VIVFVGCTRANEYLEALESRSIGRVIQRGEWPQRLYAGERWMYDNGAFGDYLTRRPFDSESFLHDVTDIQSHAHRPFACIVPDIVGVGRESLDFSVGWREQLPDNLNWYLVIQDNVDANDVQAALEPGLFRGLFIGGTDFCKAGAPLWAKVAHDVGLPCHYGRASTPAKLRWAWDSGCDSADTSFPLWTKKRFWTWLRSLDVGCETAQEEFSWKDYQCSTTPQTS